MVMDLSLHLHLLSKSLHLTLWSRGASEQEIMGASLAKKKKTGGVCFKVGPTRRDLLDLLFGFPVKTNPKKGIPSKTDRPTQPRFASSFRGERAGPSLWMSMGLSLGPRRWTSAQTKLATGACSASPGFKHARTLISKSVHTQTHAQKKNTQTHCLQLYQEKTANTPSREVNQQNIVYYHFSAEKANCTMRPRISKVKQNVVYSKQKVACMQAGLALPSCM